MNEIADASPGVVGEKLKLAIRQQRGGGEEDSGGEGGGGKAETVVRQPPKLRIASVQRDGKVRIEATDDFEGLKR